MKEREREEESKREREKESERERKRERERERKRKRERPSWKGTAPLVWFWVPLSRIEKESFCLYFFHLITYSPTHNA